MGLLVVRPRTSPQLGRMAVLLSTILIVSDYDLNNEIRILIWRNLTATKRYRAKGTLLVSLKSTRNGDIDMRMCDANGKRRRA